MPRKKATKRAPKAERPNIPDYGIATEAKGLLPWSWAAKQLAKSRQYWFSSVRPDGTPHVMPIWGVWVEARFYFSTGAKTRKARNLAKNPYCVVCAEDAEEAVIVEGTAREVKDKPMLQKVFKSYKAKYKMDVSGMGSPVYAVQPRIAFGLIEKKFPKTATRWQF